MTITEVFKSIIGEYLIEYKHWNRTVYSVKTAEEHYTRYNNIFLQEKNKAVYLSLLFSDKDYTKIEINVALTNKEETTKGSSFYLPLKEKIIKLLNNIDSNMIEIDIAQDFYLPLMKKVGSKLTELESYFKKEPGIYIHDIEIPAIKTTPEIIIIPKLTTKHPKNTYQIEL